MEYVVELLTFVYGFLALAYARIAWRWLFDGTDSPIAVAILALVAGALWPLFVGGRLLVHLDKSWARWIRQRRLDKRLRR